jgi:hypothetical protein
MPSPSRRRHLLLVAGLALLPLHLPVAARAQAASEWRARVRDLEARHAALEASRVARMSAAGPTVTPPAPAASAARPPADAPRPAASRPAPPPRTAPSLTSALAALGWSALCLALALRSTRWR